MFNEIILIGKLVKKPVLREAPNGIKLSTIIIEVERPYRNNLGIKDHDFINCVLWRGISEAVNDCCEAGSMLGIKGRLQSRTYETSENQTMSSLEVKVEHVEFLDQYLIKK